MACCVTWMHLLLIALNVAAVLSLAVVSNPILTNNDLKTSVDQLRPARPQAPPRDPVLLLFDGAVSPVSTERDPDSREFHPERQRHMKRGNLVEDCVRKARLVYYRSQVSQDQPEFVRVCKMMWQMISEKSADMKRTSPGTWAMWANRALHLNRFINHKTYFIPQRFFYRVRIADEKRGGHSARNVLNKNRDQMKEPQNSIEANIFENELADNNANANALSTEPSFSNAFAARDMDLERDPSSVSHGRSKRSPWAGSENRYNVLDMLRTRLHARGKKRTRATNIPGSSHTRSRSSLLHGRSLSALHGLRRLKRNTWYPDLAEIVQRHAADFARSPQDKKAQRPSDRHPFVGGMGDYAAEMALQTYAQLLKSELNNENMVGGASKTTRNARPFIG